MGGGNSTQKTKIKGTGKKMQVPCFIPSHIPIPTHLPTCLPACPALPACLPYLPTRLPTCPPTYLPSCCLPRSRSLWRTSGTPVTPRRWRAEPLGLVPSPPLPTAWTLTLWNQSQVRQSPTAAHSTPPCFTFVPKNKNYFFGMERTGMYKSARRRQLLQRARLHMAALLQASTG